MNGKDGELFRDLKRFQLKNPSSFHTEILLYFTKTVLERYDKYFRSCHCTSMKNYSSLNLASTYFVLNPFQISFLVNETYITSLFVLVANRING